MATVLQANKESSELGGHIASYQSAATLYEVGFNHFWHAPSDDHGGDLVFMQGHSRPASTRARSSRAGSARSSCAASARRSARTAASTARHLLLSAPVADAGLLAVPDRLDGARPDHGDLPGALHEVPPRPRDRRHRRAARCGRFLGDGETDEPESLGAISLAGREKLDNLDLRRQLQPAAPRRAGARQRQDHPGARDGLPRRGLERDQGRSGARAGTRCSPRDTRAGCSRAWRRPSTASTRRSRRATAPTCASTSSASTRSCSRWSRTCPTTRSGRSTAAATTRRRSTPPTPRPCAHTGQPTVILAKTIKGYGMGEAGEGQNITHQQKKMTEEALLAFRDRFGLDLSDEQVRRRRLPPAARRTRPEMTLPARAPRRRSAAACRRGARKAEPLPVPDAVGVRARSWRAPASARSRRRWRSCASSTRCCATSRSARTSCRSCPTSRARSAWRACSASSGSSASSGQLYQPEDADQLMFYKEDKKGQILQEGINEAGRVLVLDRRRHVVLQPRRADDPVLHLLLDVRLPARRRPRLGRRRHRARAGSCSAAPPGARRSTARACSTRTATRTCSRRRSRTASPTTRPTPTRSR